MNTTAQTAKAHFWLKFEDGEYKNWAAPRDFGTQWFVLRNLYPNSPKAKATNKKRAKPVPDDDSSDEDITLAELRERAKVHSQQMGDPDEISEDEIGAIRVRSAVSRRAPPSPRPRRTRANADPDLQQAEATRRAMLIPGGF